MLAAASGLVGCQSPFGGPPAGGGPGPALRRIAFASCIDQTAPQPIWQAVLDARPELMIFGGDNVYASQPPWSRERLRAAYTQQAEQPGFARLRREVPAMAIWDDHDYGLDDGGAEFPHKQASKEEFLEFWQVPPDSDRRFRDGLYFARSFGPPRQRVQVILLDTRWFRSPLTASPAPGTPGMERYVPDPDPAKTMLGAVQWRWLESRLREEAALRLVVSSIQVLADGHGWERWGNLPLERRRLFDTIARTRAQGAVFLSGDRHIGAFYRQAEGLPYPLHEMTSSGITHPWAAAAETGPRRVGDLVTVQHFGQLDIDWAAGTLHLSLRDVDGRERHGLRLALDELQPR